MRRLELDVLRAAAIFLVLGAHLPKPPTESGEWLAAPLGFWKAHGWIGVDLFFVLSGFLVSGLLFMEFKKYGALDIRRFLVRRGLKIYPAFYVYLIVSLLLATCVRGLRFPWQSVVGEVLFLQNYMGTTWFPHTWSLAVEEHFYLALALLLGMMMALWPSKPFRLIGVLSAGVAVVVLLLRIAYAYFEPDFVGGKHDVMTHLRIDSLMFGVLISYWYHFVPQRLAPLQQRPLLLLAASLLLVGVAISIPKGGLLMRTVGFTLLYLGFGGVLILAISYRPGESAWVGRLLRPVGFIGVYSYSIYLWHWLVFAGVHEGAARLVGEDRIYLLVVVTSLVGGVTVGIMMAKLVEVPVLRLRDRFFPSKSSAEARSDSGERQSGRPLATAGALTAHALP